MTLEDFISNEKGDFTETLKNYANKLLGIDGKPLNLKYVLGKNLDDLYGHEFYVIITALKLNIETLSKKGFSNIPVNKTDMKKNFSGLNNFERFVKQFLIDQKDFADKAGIDATRLNKILKRDRKDFYAYEVYHISVSERIEVKSAFEQLYKTMA